MTLGHWIANNCKALDVLFNTSVLFSSRVETFSRRAGRARHEGKRWGCIVCAILNPAARAVLWALREEDEPDHCESARLAKEIV